MADDSATRDAATRDRAFSSRLQSLEFEEAAAQLLGAVETPIEWTQTNPDASFIRMADVPTAFTPPASDSSFANIATMSVVDNPPNHGLRTSEVHRFVLHAELATHLNEQLLSDATQHSQMFPGSLISNVGGFHSQATYFDPLDNTQWYGPLHALVIEALHILHVEGEVDCQPIESLRTIGWMNVSPGLTHPAPSHPIQNNPIPHHPIPSHSTLPRPPHPHHTTHPPGRNRTHPTASHAFQLMLSTSCTITAECR